ncbi:hypothetical protein M5K25_016199 [Dendrobium thyrsiflorum]|uniref:RRM domain-containing protein n=1 Tax=Dendrobium thyrsiflorum TaxID=117978 RepID=A0ABD0UIW8_DENTH
MSRVYVGNLDPRVNERDLEDEFRVYGVIRSIWVARRPPGYAFIDFDDHRDAQDAIREMDGKNGWRVELSHNSKSGGGGGGRAGAPALGRGLQGIVVTADHLLVVGAATAGRLHLENAATAGLLLPEVGATADHHLMPMGMVLMLRDGGS